jgi:hypothetical protein
MHRVLTFLFSLLAFVLLLTGYYHPITAMQQDLGRHFLLGKMILESGSIPKTNLFSYTYPDFPFINTHWLSEVIFYLIFQGSGYFGLFLLFLTCILLAFGIVYVYTLRRSHLLAISFVSLFALRILFERTDLRPEMFSFVLCSIFVTMLYRYREKASKLIFFLIPLQLLWVNLHIYFVIGILLVFLFLIDEVIRKRTHLYNKQTKLLFLIFLLVCGVSLINPNGINGASYPLRVLENYGYTIEENQSIFLLQSLGFNKPALPYFQLTIFLMGATLLLSFRKTKPIDWLLFFVFSYLGITQVRNLSLFALVMIVPFATNLTFVMQKIKALATDLTTKQSRLLTTSLILGLFVMYLWQIPTVAAVRGIGYSVDESAKKAVDFIEQNKIKGPIFNNFDIGSYLIYRLYPEEKVFIDGRPEAYPATFIQQLYIPMQQDPSSFKAVDARYTFNMIFFSHTDQTPWATQFLTTIIRDPAWQIVYFDEFAIILLKDTPENKGIITQHKKTLEDLAQPLLQTTNKQALLQLASFFSKTNLSSQTVLTLERILQLDPNHCQSLAILSSIYAEANHPGAPIYAARYQQHCQ